MLSVSVDDGHLIARCHQAVIVIVEVRIGHRTSAEGQPSPFGMHMAVAFTLDGACETVGEDLNGRGGEREIGACFCGPKSYFWRQRRL